MTGDKVEDEVVAQLVRWAERDARVRALLLTSSRAIGAAPRDAFSDYDAIVVVANAQSFVEEDAWLREYGEPLVRFRDTDAVLGLTTYARLVLHTDYREGR